MYSFDSLTLKYFYLENEPFLTGAIVQKVQLPSRREIILTVRNLKEAKNKKLYINVNPKYPHVCFINEKTQALRNIEIPKQPPMFCMQLRKYIDGSKIKGFKYIEYDRILEFYFDYFDEIGSLTKLCLAIEFMGKYSNIILYNAQTKVVIGSLHNVSSDKSSIREIYGGAKYIYPPLKEKLDILKTSYSTFYEIARDKDINKIADNFYYLNQALLKEIFKKIDNIEDIFKLLQDIVSYKNKDFLYNFWGDGSDINEAIDSYFSNILFDEIMKNKKSKLKALLNKDIKKLSKIAQNKPDETKANEYKLQADELTIKGTDFKEAQKLYSLYKKAKTELNYAQSRYNKTLETLNYYETIIFNIENSSNFSELNEIEEELSELNLIKNSSIKALKPTVEPINYKSYEIYIGKNNKQNDYLISKIAKPDDLWFHGLNFPSSHVILKVPNNKKEPGREVLEYCAKLVKENSKAKDGGKTSIIMTKRKNLKKPPDTYLGYVTYKNEIEITI